jgi:Uncharacterized protein conserved in bacteria C-term(DUF2220)
VSAFDEQVEAFLLRLRGLGRRRLRSHDLRSHAVAVDPLIAHAADADVRLARLVDALVERGALRLPRRRASAVDILPATAFLVDNETIGHRRMSTGTRPWCRELRWFLSVPDVTPEEFRAMEQLNDFLIGGGAERPIVPLRERSLPIFKDEKTLDRLARGRLRHHCDLIALARAYRPHPPLHHARIGDGPWALVAENYDTYHSLRDLCPADGDIGIVAYGTGSHFTGAVLSFLDIDAKRPQRILYFGDIDPRGLRMPILASELAVQEGLPPVEPAAALYRLLFDVGEPRPLRSEAKVHDDWIRWLPSDLRTRTRDMLRARRRLAQEWVGWEVLAEHREILRNVVP